MRSHAGPLSRLHLLVSGARALPVTHALPCWCVVTWLLSCFLVLPAESKASGVTSVIVEDLYVCPRQMLGFRGLSSV